MPHSQVSPVRAIYFILIAPIVFMVAAYFVPAAILRDIFNPLAFAVAAFIAATWARSAYEGLKNGINSGAWFLIFGVFLTWFVAMLQRIYAMGLNALSEEQAAAWRDGPISAFWPYSFFIAGALILSAPGVDKSGIAPKSILALIAAVATGGFVAGLVVMYQIGTS